MRVRPSTSPLIARIADLDSLRAAWEQIRSKRASGGVDEVSVEAFEQDLEANLEELRDELLAARYLPQPLRHLTIPKGTRSKGFRDLYLPTVRDKVAQQSVRAVLEPRLNKCFLDCSYAYRRGKGAGRAIARVSHCLKNLHLDWVVKADIDEFFPSLNHTLLMDRLGQVISDAGILRLIELWLKIGVIDGRGHWHDIRSGVGQGAILSPLLANFYLHPFDEYILQGGYSLVRYSDDFLILCKTRSDAENAFSRAGAFLEAELNLRLNANLRPICQHQVGFGFLGIWFENGKRDIDGDKLDKIQHKTFRLAKAVDKRQAIQDLNGAVSGWRRYYGALVDNACLHKIDDLVYRGWIQLVADGFARKYWSRPHEAELALHDIATLRSTPYSCRARRLKQIVQEGVRKRSDDEARKKQQEADRKSTKRRSRTGARAGEPVTTAVRRAKRAQGQRHSAISDLYVNTPGSFVGKTGQSIVIRQQRRTVCQLPLIHTQSITIASKGVSFSSDAAVQCSEKGIPVILLSKEGKVAALLTRTDFARANTGRLQLQAVDRGEPALKAAKAMIEGKIRNQINLMKYFQKYHGGVNKPFAAAFPERIAAMDRSVSGVKQLEIISDFDLCRNRLFSLEGRAAEDYWHLIKLLLAEHMEFPGRRHREATDLTNVLLNYGYAILQARVHLAILRAGLIPQISLLHAFRGNTTPTLVFDLMEEFRPQVVDRPTLSLVLRREPMSMDDENRLTMDTRQRLIRRIHERLASLVRFRGRELKINEIIGCQAKRLVAHLMAKKPYRPYVARW